MSLCPSNSCIVLQVCSLFQQVGGKGVAEHVYMYPMFDACTMAASFSTLTNALAEYCSPGVSPSNSHFCGRYSSKYALVHSSTFSDSSE